MINDLRRLLLAQPAITALVHDRGYIDAPAASSLLPRIIIHQMGSDEQNDLIASGDARSVNLDIDCEGATGQDAFTLAAAVRLFLKDYSGPTVSGGVTIDAVILNDEHSKKPEKTTQPGQVRQFLVTLDVDVLYRP